MRGIGREFVEAAQAYYAALAARPTKEISSPSKIESKLPFRSPDCRRHYVHLWVHISRTCANL